MNSVEDDAGRAGAAEETLHHAAIAYFSANPDMRLGSRRRFQAALKAHAAAVGDPRRNRRLL